MTQIKKIFFILIFLITISNVFAIPAPDFFIAFFQAFLQFLGIIVAIFLSYVLIVFKYVKTHKKKVLHILIAFLIVVILSFIVYNYFKLSSQKVETEWRQNVKEDISNSITESIQINTQNSNLNNINNSYLENLVNFSYNRDYYKNIYLNNSIKSNNISVDDFNLIYFDKVINQDFYVIDLRERIEYQEGHINGSIHSRDVDFILGDSLNVLPENKSKLIILTCYSSLSSSYFVYYLNSIGYLNVQYLEDGLNNENIENYDWFIGNYSSKYDDISYVDLSEINTYKNIIFLDVRKSSDFNLCNLNNSISFFRDSISTSNIINFVEDLNENKNYYLICNGNRNCWSAYNLGRDMMNYNNISPAGLIDLSINNNDEFFYKNCNVNSENFSDQFWKEHEIISNLDSERIIFNNSQIKNNIIDEDEFVDLRENSNMLIIDLRDNISFSRGSIQGAIHSKLSDFINGDWKNLNLSDYDSIFLICYGGTSGYLATEFLFNNGYRNVYYFENGIYDIYNKELINYNGEMGLQVDEDIKYNFMSKYDFEGYVNLSNVQVLEVRPFNNYINDKKRNDSLYFFHEAMTSKKINEFYNKLDKNKEYILYCDSSLTCWLTNVIYLEMKEKGFNYLGKYTENINYLTEMYEYGFIEENSYNNIIGSLENE